MSIIRNRELSQFGSFVYIDNNTQSVGIATEVFPYVGIGTANPIVKFHVVGDTNINGNLTVTGGNIDANSFTVNGTPLNIPTNPDAIYIFGSLSGVTTIKSLSIASGIITVPSANDILVARNTTDTLTNKTISASSNTITGLTNSNLSGSAGISNANLANSTISGVSLGSTLSSLTFGSYLSSSGVYNGSTARTVSVAATSDNTTNTVVVRDSNGNFIAGIVTVTNLNSNNNIQISNTSVIDSSRNLINVVNGNFSGIVTGGTLNSNNNIQISNTSVIDSGRNLINVVNGNFSGIVTGGTLNSNNNIQISGTTVINSQRRVATGMVSLYDRVFAVGVNTTLQNRDFCSVTASGRTITLPASPSAGNQVTIKVGNFQNTTIGRNGSNIMSLGEDMIINILNATVDLIFVNSTQGWEIT